MINQVVLVGGLTRDPELRTANSGNPITSFTIAVEGKMKDDKGKRKPNYIDCVAFRSQAEVLCKYARKGSKIGVVGSLNYREYKRQDGSTAKVIEVLCDSVTLIDTRNGRDVAPAFDDDPTAPKSASVDSVEPSFEENDAEDNSSIPADDDLPFLK